MFLPLNSNRMKNMDDLRVSISIYGAGSARGDTGLTAFITSGKKIHLAYTDDYLIRHGDEYSSTIAMADTGYMNYNFVTN